MLAGSKFLISNHSGGSIRTYADRNVFAVPTFPGLIPEAGTFYLDLSGVLKPGSTNMGIYIQSSAALNVRITMASTSEVRQSDASVPWSTAVSIAAGEVILLKDMNGDALAGSTLEIVSSGRAKIYVGSL